MDGLLETVRVLSYRHPSVTDAVAMHELAMRCAGLDVNSRYAYLLLGAHFRQTCLLAVANETVVGFASGYWIPDRLKVLFVWQIGVEPAWRGRGVAGNLLGHLLDGLAQPPVFIETTITPSNTASHRLFVSLARRLGAVWTQAGGFAESLFAPERHEAEYVFRIGPLVRGGAHPPDSAHLNQGDNHDI